MPLSLCPLKAGTLGLARLFIIGCIKAVRLSEIMLPAGVNKAEPINTNYRNIMEANSHRLDKLKQRHADLQLKIRREQQKLLRNERRKDTRRKILAGAEALAESDKDNVWKAKLMGRLNENLESDSDRELFGLKGREGK